MTYDLAVNDALVAGPQGSFHGSVGVRDGVIAAIAAEPLRASVEVDAAGRVLMPGVVDAHLHFKIAQGSGPDAVVGSDDYVIGPRAAAHGGVTTFIDFAIQPAGQTVQETVRDKVRQASEGSIVDFSFHAGITDDRPPTLSEIGPIVAMGIPSFKFFMTYRAWGFYVNRGFMAEAMAEIARHGGIALVHAEDDEMLEYQRAKLGAEDPSRMLNHALSRPELAEELAIRDAVQLARAAEATLYVVHLTTRRGLEAIEAARREGVRVITETCPHYLAFSQDVYDEPDGRYFTMTPPLRRSGNPEALWNGLARGAIEVMGSDHNSFTRVQKDAATGFLDIPPGIYGTEMLLPYVLSDGVNAGRITLERAVALVCTNPATIYRLPGKGAIAMGYDADLVLVDLDEEREVSDASLHDPTAYTVFAGRRMRGWPVMTISRGEIVVDGEECVAEEGRGRFVARPGADGRVPAGWAP